ncbi:MAG TPA: hypothetical protein VMV47_15145 [Bacteroidales bacterium]|nr:hypothetical protein [Bacteroidales bacterium]
MKILTKHFRLNGLPYTLLKRNDKVALYGIGGTYTDEILHYEVDIIYIRKDKYGEREAIPSNGQFGRDRSRCFANEKLAQEWYDKLTTELYQVAPKLVSGVGQNTEVITEYQLV